MQLQFSIGSNLQFLSYHKKINAIKLHQQSYAHIKIIDLFLNKFYELSFQNWINNSRLKLKQNELNNKKLYALLTFNYRDGLWKTRQYYE